MRGLKRSQRPLPTGDDDHGGTLTAPVALLDYTPLAVYANTLVGALNTLRACAPLTIAPALMQMLVASLTRIADAVVTAHAHRPDSADDLNRVSLLLLDHCVPFVDACVRSVFPAPTMAAALGCSQSKIADIHAKMFTIDTTRMRKVLKQGGDDDVRVVATSDTALEQHSAAPPQLTEPMHDIDLSSNASNVNDVQ